MQQQISLLLSPSPPPTRTMNCPHCGCNKVKRNGKASNGQRYICKKCGRSFVDRPGFDRRMKHSRKVVDFALCLSSQNDPAFSTRDISQRILKKFHLQVSHATVATWIAQSSPEILFYIPCFACLLNNPLKTSSWHCKPQECDKLSRWLSNIVEDTNSA